MVNIRRKKEMIVFFTEFEIMKPYQGWYVNEMNLYSMGKLGVD